MEDVTDQPTTVREPGTALFWLWWALATTLGGVVGILLIRSFVVSIARLLSFNIAALLIIVGVFTIVGVMQWLVLRLYIPHMALWILATAGSGLIGWLAFVSRFVATPAQFLPALFSSVTITQLVLAVPQSALLQSRLGKGWLWIGVNLVGWMLANPIARLVLPLGEVANIIASRGTWAVVTGIYLTHLLRDEITGELAASD